MSTGTVVTGDQLAERTEMVQVFAQLHAQLAKNVQQASRRMVGTFGDQVWPFADMPATQSAEHCRYYKIEADERGAHVTTVIGVLPVWWVRSEGVRISIGDLVAYIGERDSNLMVFPGLVGPVVRLSNDTIEADFRGQPGPASVPVSSVCRVELDEDLRPST